MVALAASLPVTLLQVSVKVPVNEGETTDVPDVARVPLQLPEAVQLLALVLDQVSVDDSPSSIDVGAAVNVTVGAGGLTVTVVVAAPLPVRFEQVNV